MFKYIPAHAPGTFENFEIDGKPMRWWSKDNPFYKYNYLLVSAFMGVQSKWTREEYVKDKDVIVFGDSGGFQAVTLGKTQPTISVLKWLEANCDVGFTLDYSPFEKNEKPDGKSVKNIISLEKFKENIEKTYQNNLIYERERDKNSKLKIYNVIHGHNKERLDLWYSKMKDFKFEGYAVGSQPPYGNPIKQVIGALYLWDKGHRENQHIFAVSGATSLPVLCYLGKYFKLLTADSSSYAIGRMYCSFISPYKMSYCVPFGMKGKGLELKELPCTCEVCSYINKEIDRWDFYSDLPEQTRMLSIRGNIITLHNLNMFIKYVDIMNKLVVNKELFIDYIKRHFDDADIMIKTIDFIDTVVEKGFDYGYEKYVHELQFDEKTTTKKLFEF